VSITRAAYTHILMILNRWDKTWEQSKIKFITAGKINLLYSLLGDTESRIFWLEKMYEQNSGDLPYLAIRNDDSIQQDPRYIAVMRKIGLWP